MQKKQIIAISGAVLLLILGVGLSYAYKNFRGAGPAFRKPGDDITKYYPTTTPSSSPEGVQAVNNTNLPLTVAKGFAITTLAKNLPGARVAAIDGFGNLWVSQTSQGTITNIELKNGSPVRQAAVFKNLDRPHGLVIYNNVLYFAEETKITKVTLYSDDRGQKIADLPAGGRHYTRTLGLGPDERLYVSIGSTCDVCYEQDSRLAAIYSLKLDGSDFRPVARGLRNSVFFTWDYVFGKLWATEMGRDNLGDDLPPDEINVIDMGPGSSPGRAAEPLDFGWPVCYGQNIHDTNFDKNTYIQNPCNGKIAPRVELSAHSAPLGLSFFPEEPAWPEEYWGDLIVALHGSWNRSQPTGYKLVRVKLSDKGEFQGMEDFISGWLAKDGKTSLGRPVDVTITASGYMYVTDDKAGVVYKITPSSP